MQQRASIVRALSFNPSVLLMDEPFGALDAFTRDEMNLMVEEIWLETRKTIVLHHPQHRRGSVSVRIGYT